MRGGAKKRKQGQQNQDQPGHTDNQQPNAGQSGGPGGAQLPPGTQIVYVYPHTQQPQLPSGTMHQPQPSYYAPPPGPPPSEPDNRVKHEYTVSGL